MNENQISPDDPRLTLYALGEMTPPERADFELLLEQNPAARQAVAEIRATVETVSAALQQEPIETAPASAPAKVIRFPQAYFMISGLAAACFAVFFVLWQSEHELKKQSHLVEIPLTAAKESKDDKSVGNESVALPALATPVATADAGIATAQAPAPAVALQLAESSPMPPAPPLQDSYRGASQQARADVVSLRAEVDAQATAEARARSAKRFVERQVLARYSELPAPPPSGDANTEAYAYIKDNGYVRVADQPLSTFSIDVDTASYANVRRFLTNNRRPPVDAVRIEELVNYFPYDYAPPAGDVPFAATLEAAEAPWASNHRLVRIGIKGREVSDRQRPPANLVFLLDVSGSMNQPHKLPLVKQSLRLLVEKLRADDRVAIVFYANGTGLALPSTQAREKGKILAAIGDLRAGGSTNGALGIQLAYDIAKANFVTGGVNRVILATDGDFNVGTTSQGELVRLISEKAASGVFLSVLGFGMGNLKDSMLEQIADQGNGHYAYIDSLAEARKTLVEQAGGTLVTIAKDVKIQVEFNPAQVQAYRLIGYENRLLAKEDFNNDKVDAGEIGAGHTVTALYEVVPVGAKMPEESAAVDGLKYQKTERGAGSAERGARSREEGAGNLEMLTVKVRYKEPGGEESARLEFPLVDAGTRFADASADFKFAAAVAGFGMALRESPHKGSLTLADVLQWGRAGLGQDAGGYRAEFLTLVGTAEGLMR